VLQADFPSDRGFWERVWAHRILGRGEREPFRRLGGPESRRLEWLAGRAAAKEAVRSLLASQHGLDVPLPDIEIHHDEQGRPLVDGAWRDLVPDLPVVSIAHTQGLAVAVAGLAPARAGEALLLGIDAEYVAERAPGFAEVAFDGDELRTIRSLPPGLQEEWLHRAWCAKEAVGKALGVGLIEGPRCVRVDDIDPEGGKVAVRLGVRLAGAFPALAEEPLSVTTGRHGDLIVASMIGKLAGAELVGVAVPSAF
jgi:phosphopantetheinyl transferase (holo-ACP synthase)